MRLVIRSAWLVLLLLVLCQTAAAGAATVLEPPRNATRELVGRRTATSRTWLMPSGRRITRIASSPVQRRGADGAWRAYDTPLRRQGNRWTAASGAAKVSLPQALNGMTDGRMQVTGSRGDTVRMALHGASGGARLDGEQLVYDDVLPDVDLVTRAVAGGLKEDVVLLSPDAQRRLAYRLDADGLDVRQDGGGLVLQRDDQPLFRIPAPVVYDAGERITLHNRLTARHLGSGIWEVALELDERWLDAPERTWPVTVDPTIVDVATFTSSTGANCQIHYGNNHHVVPPRMSSDGTTAQAHCLYDVRYVGHHLTGDVWWADYNLLRFDTLSLVPTDTIASARLTVHRTGGSLPNNSPIGVYGATRSTAELTVPPTSPNLRYLLGSYDRARIARLEPSGGTGLSADVSSIVSQWRRHGQTTGATGKPNFGVVLQHEDLIHNTAEMYGHAASQCHFQACDFSVLASSAHGDRSLRPVLEVTSWPAAKAGSIVTSPTEGTHTSRFLKLKARASDDSVTSARFQYMVGGDGLWADIPLASLYTAERQPLTRQDVPVTGGSQDRTSELVVWDVSKVPYGDVDGPVRVRAFLESPEPLEGGMTPEVEARIDRRGSGADPVPLGPGEVDLTTGELTVSRTDARMRGFIEDLTLSRTYSSRGFPSRASDMFGPGWSANIDVDAGQSPYAGLYAYTDVRREVSERHEYREYHWEQPAAPSGGCGDLFDNETGDPGADGKDDCGWEPPPPPPPGPNVPLYTRETIPTIREWTYHYAVVTFADGQKVTFKQTVHEGTVTGWETEDEAPGYSLTRTLINATHGYEYRLEDPDGQIATFRPEAAWSPHHRLQSVREPGSPTAATYTYQPLGTRQVLRRVTAPYPTGADPRWIDLTWDSVGSGWFRVVAARVGTGAGAGTEVARYSYYDNGLLRAAWDPRGSTLATESYGYDHDGRLLTLAPNTKSGAAWQLDYVRADGDRGRRLAWVQRRSTAGLLARTTIRYDVPLEGTGAPYDMSVRETARWRQQGDGLPWTATAVIEPDEADVGREPETRRGTIYYFDVEGRTVNEISPGGHVLTRGYDVNGNLVRELSAENRERALAAGAGSATRAQELSRLFQYSADGESLTAAFGPLTEITLRPEPGSTTGRVVTGRRLSTTHYDANAPAGGPYHLPTSEWTAVWVDARTQYDVREAVRYDYEPVAGMSGWRARTWTRRIVDPNDLRLTYVRKLHPTYPLVEELRKPNLSRRQYRYRGISSNVVSTYLACDTIGAVDGFLCAEGDDVAASDSALRRYYSYDALGRILEIRERKPPQGSPLLRTRLKTYTPGGATDTTTTIEFTTIDGMVFPREQITVKNVYDGATGEVVARHTMSGTTATDSIYHAYDAWGRMVAYQDASGTFTRYGYDLAGRLTEQVAPNATTRFGYDEDSNLVSVTDPLAGAAITATYDADGRLLSEELPNGVVARQTYDEEGAAKQLRWLQTIGCTTNCELVRSDVSGRDARGAIAGIESNWARQSFRYDDAGRLRTTDDVTGGSCTRRIYLYDANSNRRLTDARVAPACGGGTQNSRSWSYDLADRITSGGWRYDVLDRATNVPAPDSGSLTRPLSVEYFADDRVRFIATGSTYRTFARDPDRRTRTVNNTLSLTPVTSTYHYVDEGDAPAYISRSDGTVDRHVTGPSGQVVLSSMSGAVTYQLRDVTGSIVAVLPTTSGTTTTLRSSRYDPFGRVLSARPNVIEWSDSRPVLGNGWLGGHQRTTLTEQSQETGPLIEMGARVYLPEVGRFLQPDPVDGGSANAYDYVNQDPVNGLDLEGTCSNNNPFLAFGCIFGDRNYDDHAKKALGKAVGVAGGAWGVAKKFIGRCFNGIRSGLIAALGTVIVDKNRELGQILKQLRNGKSIASVLKTEAGKRFGTAIRAARGGVLVGIGVSCLTGGW